MEEKPQDIKINNLKDLRASEQQREMLPVPHVNYIFIFTLIHRLHNKQTKLKHK